MRRWRESQDIKKEQTDRPQAREKATQTIDHRSQTISDYCSSSRDTPTEKGNILYVYYESYIQNMEVKVEEKARSMEGNQIQIDKYTEI